MPSYECLKLIFRKLFWLFYMPAFFLILYFWQNCPSSSGTSHLHIHKTQNQIRQTRAKSKTKYKCYIDNIPNFLMWQLWNFVVFFFDKLTEWTGFFHHFHRLLFFKKFKFTDVKKMRTVSNILIVLAAHQKNKSFHLCASSEGMIRKKKRNTHKIGTHEKKMLSVIF